MGVRRRWVKVLTITVVVLAVLFTVADRVAVHYADKEAAHLAARKYGYANTTDGTLDVSIEGFPFLTQLAALDFSHVKLTAGRFTLSTTTNRQGGYLHVDELNLDLYGVTVTSLTARSAEANRATGSVTLSYKELSGVLSRLAHAGPLTVSRAPGSHGQAARITISGAIGGTKSSTTATLLAQGDEVTVRMPGGREAGTTWRVPLPQNVGFTAARATDDGVQLTLVGHQVQLGTSRFGR